MGRELQKKKRRSGKQPIRQSQKLKRPINPLGNSLIAKNWNKKETLSQNYKRLGLVARLGKPTGGTETSLHGKPSASSSTPLGIPTSGSLVVGETKVERDADGKIVRVVSGRRRNPLNDPLVEFDSDFEEEEEEEDEDMEAEDVDEEWEGIDDEQSAIVRQLEEESRRPVVKKPRHQSGREVVWVERLIEKYGDDYAKMAKDRTLNPMQQTEADIARRIKRFNAKRRSDD